MSSSSSSIVMSSMVIFIELMDESSDWIDSSKEVEGSIAMSSSGSDSIVISSETDVTSSSIIISFISLIVF